MSRASDKRRALAIERALRFFDEATCWFDLSRSYRQICRDRIRKAARPTAAAKAQVRDLAQVQGRRKHSKPGTCPDFSWATEARAEMWRRHGRRWNPPPHDDLLRQLERRLLQGEIGQQAFDERCSTVIEKPLPTWMTKFVEPGLSLRATRIPSAVLHRILGCGELKPGEDTTALTIIPPVFQRALGAPEKHGIASEDEQVSAHEGTLIRKAS